MEQKLKLNFNIEKIITRSPRLETIVMVENFIKKNSGKFKKTELFHRLPKKVMWGTFNIILKYLWDTNKIGIDNKGYIMYIWSPEAGELFKNRKRY